MRKLIITSLVALGYLPGAAQTTPKMETQAQLGNACTIDYGITDMDKAISFYEHLDYKVLDKNEGRTLISDGTLLICLDKGQAPYQQLTYYSDQPEMVANILKTKSLDVTEKRRGQFQVKTPDGVVINLVKSRKEIQQPKGKSLITMSPSDFGDASKYPNAKCGAFGEYSIPVADLDKSMAFWEKLGFKSAMKNMTPYPHAILTDGIFIIGLHQNTDFTAPGLTYFAGNMADRIAKLKSEGLKEAKNLGAGNEVFSSPDGHAVFLFGL